MGPTIQYLIQGKIKSTLKKVQVSGAVVRRAGFMPNVKQKTKKKFMLPI